MALSIDAQCEMLARELTPLGENLPEGGESERNPGGQDFPVVVSLTSLRER
jgi:hypothetical protein